MELSRRKFIIGTAAILAAPAIIRQLRASQKAREDEVMNALEKIKNLAEQEAHLAQGHARSDVTSDVAKVYERMADPLRRIYDFSQTALTAAKAAKVSAPNSAPNPPL